MDDRERPASSSSTCAQIGHFQIQYELGRGGMGIVYRARDARLGRDLALKVIKLDQLSHQARARLRREARALAAVSHPNVVQVFEIGEALGVLYIAMEYVKGTTLRRWQRSGERDWRHVLGMYHQAAAGLAAVHAAGLVHRDFKPDNVLVGDDGRVRLVDFGLARHRHDGSITAPIEIADCSVDTITSVGVAMGTPAYMAPEQFVHRTFDERTDQFAFCVALFEGLYGQRPFQGASRSAQFMAMTKGRITVPPRAESSPPWLLRILRRGLEAEPEKRFASISALLSALDASCCNRRRVQWVVGTGLAIAAGIGVLQFPAAPCSGTTAWASTWTPQRRDAVSHALGTATVPYAEDTRSRTLLALDDYGARWQEHHEATCQALTHDSGFVAPSTDARTDCLDDHRQQFTALVDVLTRADPSTVEHALAAASQLPDPRLCTNPDPGRSRSRPSSVDPSAHNALLADLGTVIARRKLGHYAAARELAADVVRRAEPHDDRLLVAEAKWQLAKALIADGNPPEVIDVLRDAFFEAQGQQMNLLASTIATELVYQYGHWKHQLSEADAWVEHARALAKRHDPLMPVPRLTQVIADVDLARRRYPDALVGYRAALAEARGLFGDDDPRVLRYRDSLAEALLAMGETDEAIEVLERSAVLYEQWLGAHHPTLAAVLSNLGLAQQQRGEHDDAIATLERARSIGEATLDPTHVYLRAIRAHLAVSYVSKGDHEYALGQLQEVLARTIETRGEDHAEVAIVLLNMACPLIELGRLAQAVVTLERALMIAEEHYPLGSAISVAIMHALARAKHELGHEDALGIALEVVEIRRDTLPSRHPDLALAYGLVATIYRDVGMLSEAHGASERAMEIYEDANVPPGTLAGARMDLAKILWMRGEQPDRARALANQALEVLREAGPTFSASLDDAERWLAERTP
ncbi:MAG: serine/threonine-protein kinase [Myxococcota bacterium]